MTIRRLSVYFLGCACVAVLGATQGGFFAPPHPDLEQVQPKKKSGPARPEDFGLFVAPAHLDFGEAFEDRQFAWTVAIENRGTNEVHLKRFVTACSCLEIAPSSLSIPPGERAEVALKLDLTPSPREPAVPLVRKFQTSFQAALRLPSGEEIALDRWELSGIVRKVVDVSRLQLDLGKHSERRQPIPSQQLSVTSVVPVRGIIAKCDSAQFSVDLTPDKEKPSQRNLRIVPKGTVPIGRYSFEIQLEAELQSGQKVQPREILVRGEIAADIQASPPIVDLGARPRGSAVDQVVTLYSLTDCPFNVVGFHSESKGLTIDSVSLDSNAAQPRFRLSQRIEQLGGQRARVVFLVVSEDGITSEARVAVDYHGIEPAQD